MCLIWRIYFRYCELLSFTWTTTLVTLYVLHAVYTQSIRARKVIPTPNLPVLSVLYVSAYTNSRPHTNSTLGHVDLSLSFQLQSTRDCVLSSCCCVHCWHPQLPPFHRRSENPRLFRSCWPSSIFSSLALVVHSFFFRDVMPTEKVSNPRVYTVTPCTH